MQEAFGCVVKNRFFQLLDDESDPLDFLHQTSVELNRSKKKEETAAKKAGSQRSNKKESQKDRKTIVANTEAPGLKRAPKQSMQKLTEDENSSTEMNVERSERRTAFREFRPNFIDKSKEYRVDNFRVDKEAQVRSWIANQRGGMRTRGRGGSPRNMDYENQRGKREFERHSGSDKARIRAEDKRGGGGPHNWGAIKDFSEVALTPLENVEVTETVDVVEEQQDAQGEYEEIEDLTREMSLDEWKSMQDQSRPKIEFNLRKPESSVPSKAIVIHRSKFANNSMENEDSHYGFRKPVNDITSQLDINFGSLPRPGRGGRGGGRGNPRREDGFRHVVHNVHEFYLNPDDPEDFPALT
ncbi:intracellular hyaluronan-binding protein 4 [Leptodactylus fuscus]|uniref:intracellular hyaluronan-binding protein 4 n=1 Tax=Leptodactylus fuscus TaxID=238119 RepID=UPI003F4E67DF